MPKGKRSSLPETQVLCILALLHLCGLGHAAGRCVLKAAPASTGLLVLLEALGGCC